MTWTGSFDRRDHTCATWLLGRSTTVGYLTVGFGGMPSHHVHLFQRILFHADNPEAHFDRLLRHESRYAQIYGLIGLYWTNPQRFARLLRRYRTLEGQLRVRHGCTVGKTWPLPKIDGHLSDGWLPRAYGTAGRVPDHPRDSAEAERLLRKKLGFPKRTTLTDE